MRIAHLPSSYLPEYLGGTEVYVRSLCNGLASLGHECAVVWHTDAPAPSQWSGPEVQIRLPPHKLRKRADIYMKSTGSEPPGFRDFLVSWKPDVLHFHSFTLGAGIDHVRVARSIGIPYFITYHTPTQSCQRGTLLRWGNEPCNGQIEPRRCAECSLEGRGVPKLMASALALSPIPYKLSDGPWVSWLTLPSLITQSSDYWSEFFCGATHVVACAEFCRQVLLKNGLPEDRVTVHRQGLPGQDRERILRLPLHSEGRASRLGFFGRFTPVKGPDLLLEAVNQLRGSGIKVTAEFAGPIGTGDRAWADRLFSKSVARYHGTLQGDQLTEWLESLDLVVLPSRCLETGPLTLLEAWDRCTPVIGTNLGGIQEFFKSNGLDDMGFDHNDSHDIAKAVHRAMNWSKPARVAVPGMDELASRMIELYSKS